MTQRPLLLCSVHFRNCAESAWEDVQGAVQATLAEQPELRVTRGRKVLELRPEVRRAPVGHTQFPSTT